jgi:3'(2'), 5'-bisphosphate nucleotidase
VTDADLLSNKIITDGLSSLYPDIPVISEETVILPHAIRKNWTYCWLLDPLDGTREFLHRTGEFTINLALIHRGEAVAGFVHVPYSETTYFACKGMGAFRKKNDSLEKLQVSDFPEKNEKKRITISRFHPDKKTAAYIQTLSDTELITTGSSLKIVHIAEGKADMYPRLSRLSEWDIAATQVILEEAGGSVLSFYSRKKLMYNRRNLKLPAFIATSKPLKKRAGSR